MTVRVFVPRAQPKQSQDERPLRQNATIALCKVCARHSKRIQALVERSLEARLRILFLLVTSVAFFIDERASYCGLM
jgi:hypothetical protein